MELKFVTIKVQNQSSHYQHLYICNKDILSVFKNTLTKQVTAFVVINCSAESKPMDTF